MRSPDKEINEAGTVRPVSGRFPEPPPQWRLLLNTIKQAMFVLDRAFNITVMNHPAEQMLDGLQADRSPGVVVNFLSALPEQRRAVAETLLQQCFSGREIHYDMSYTDKTGSISWYELNYRPIANEQGDPEYVVLVIQDITSIKKNEQALLSSEERYYQMIDGIEDYAIMMLDKNGIIMNWNKGAEKIKGYAPSEIIGSSFLLFYTDEDIQQGLPWLALEQARATGRSFNEGWRIKKDGTRFWGSVTITLMRNRENQVLGFSKITRDLTEKKIANDRLTKSEFQFSSFMAHTPTMNWIIDEHGVFRYLNDSYMATFRLSEQDIGRNIYDIFPANICDEFVANNWKVWNTGQPLETYEEGVGPDGEQQFYHIYKFPLPSENGVRLLGGVSLDLTQQRKLEASLAEEEDRRKREIIHAIIDAQEIERQNIAYQLRDNVNQILTSSRLMLEVAAEKTDSYDYFVKNSLRYLQSAIEEVNRIGHSLSSATLKDIGLEDAIEEIIEDINNSGKLTVQYKKRIVFPTREWPVGILLSLLRIVQEQVKNILQHAGAETASVILKSTSRRISLNIQDDGKGFDPARTKAGLGFNNIYNRTEYYNGRVILEAAPGAGCTLIIHIPAAVQSELGA